MRTLTLRELNRATLARQMLLERQRLTVPRAVERLCAMQAQYSPAPYIGLWSRVEGFEREQLTHALERKQVVKCTLFRVTLHIVSARDYPLFASVHVGTRRAKLASRAPHVDLTRYDALLRERETVTLAEVRDLVWPEIETLTKGWMDMWSATRALVPMVHVPPSGTWRFHGEAQVTHVERWLGRGLDTEGAVEHLVRRYLAASGPASRDDLLTFAGLQVRDLGDALETMQLRRFTDETGRVLLDLPRAPLAAAHTPAPARFLAKWDSAFWPYAVRDRVLAPDLYSAIVRKNGDVLPTFTVDGFVAGTWAVERVKDKATLKLSPFAPLPRGAKGELVEEGERLVRFVEDDATSYAVR
jgi:hypothetical protein